ncbi:MAG: carboxylesterase family protein, partial [Pseudomonadota bacterium]|nr:carboxylesterase family protein [Pseudomonadota bacterium]
MNTQVETTTGPIEGREKDGTLFFAGIPYAASPTESKRFQRAQAHEPWLDVLSTKKIGAAAPQLPGSGLTDPPSVRWDENCLTLNITTPMTSGSGRPVFVWIHGGAYRTGQGGIP